MLSMKCKRLEYLKNVNYLQAMDNNCPIDCRMFVYKFEGSKISSLLFLFCLLLTRSWYFSKIPTFLLRVLQDRFVLFIYSLFFVPHCANKRVHLDRSCSKIRWILNYFLWLLFFFPKCFCNTPNLTERSLKGKKPAKNMKKVNTLPVQ